MRLGDGFRILDFYLAQLTILFPIWLLLAAAVVEKIGLAAAALVAF
jgi:hypothetical protein